MVGITRLGRWSDGSCRCGTTRGRRLAGGRGSGRRPSSRAGPDPTPAAAPPPNSAVQALDTLRPTTPPYFEPVYETLLRAPLPAQIYRQGGIPARMRQLETAWNPSGRVGNYLAGGAHPDGGQRVLPVAGHQRPRLRHLPPAAQRHGPQPAQHPLAMVGDRRDRSPVRAGRRRRLPECRGQGAHLRCPGRRADRHGSRADSRRRTRFWSAAARSASRCLGRRGPSPARSSRSSSPWRSARATTGPAATRTRATG